MWLTELLPQHPHPRSQLHLAEPAMGTGSQTSEAQEGRWSGLAYLRGGLTESMF